MSQKHSTTELKTAYLRPVFFGSFAFVFLNFSLPIRADDLGIDAVGIGGMYAVFTSALLVFRPLIGMGLDKFGRRRFFICAFLFYILAMLVFCNSATILDFYLARFLQGVGASLMWVSVKTIATDIDHSKSIGAAMGKLTTTSVRGSMIGGSFGFTLLGFMPMQTAWVWAFAGYALASLIGLLLSFLVAETQPADSAQYARLRLKEAVNLPARLNKALVIIFLSSFASALIEPLYLLYLKSKFDVNILLLALVFLPAGLVHAILPQYAGSWSDKWGRGPVIAIGVSIAGCLSIALPQWESLWLIALSYLMFAVGWAMAMPAEEALIADLANTYQRGATIGIKEASGGLGAALGPLVGGVIYKYWDKEMAFVVNGTLLILVARLAIIWFNQRRLDQK